MPKTSLTPANNRLLPFRKNPIFIESVRNGSDLTIEFCKAKAQNRGKKSRIPEKRILVKTVPVILMETRMPETTRKLMQKMLVANGSRLSFSSTI